MRRGSSVAALPQNDNTLRSLRMTVRLDLKLAEVETYTSIVHLGEGPK